jgi:hypothetical protein
MTAGTAVAVSSTSPRNAERPVLDDPAAKMLNGFPRRVRASRLVTHRSSQQFLGLHRDPPDTPRLGLGPGAQWTQFRTSYARASAHPADPIGDR